jgi:hypothetical protein
VLVLRIVESWDGCGCSLGGERWDEKKEEGETEEESVGRSVGI